MTDFSFWLGEDAEEYRFPYENYAKVDYSNWDLDEGLPDDELTEVVFEADFCIEKLPEECPHDFGPLEIEEPDHDE